MFLGQEIRQEKKNRFALCAWGGEVTVDLTLFVAFLDKWGSTLAPPFYQHTSNFPKGSSLGTTRYMYIPQSTLVASTLIILLTLTNVENFPKKKNYFKKPTVCEGNERII